MKTEPFLKDIAMTELYILKNMGITDKGVLSTKFSFNLLRIINMHGLKSYITVDWYIDKQTNRRNTYMYIRVIEDETTEYIIDAIQSDSIVTKISKT